MKISIITATYNSTAYIAECIASVNNQTYPNIEHIIIDGASTDNTREIIKSTPNRVVQIVSEPDQGIYDALNKGLKLASGDIIGFIHADDIFATNDIIQKVISAIKVYQVDAVYGDIVIVKKYNNIYRIWRSNAFSLSYLNFGWMPAHTSLFIKKIWYEKIGLFDMSFRISGDYDFILRLFQQPNFTSAYIPEVMVRMQHGGTSSKNLKNIIQKSREDLKAIRKNKLKYPYFTLLAKNLRKLPQFINY